MTPREAVLLVTCSFPGVHPQQRGRWPPQALCVPFHACHVLPDLGHGLSCHLACREGMVDIENVKEQKGRSLYKLCLTDPKL